MPQKAARVGANTLPVYRAWRGLKTAERLRGDMQNPGDRTWGFAGRVALDVGTDLIDGRLARYAGTTKLGGYLDTLADKVWANGIINQFVANEELPAYMRNVMLTRDIATMGLRGVRSSLGLSADADMWGRIKMDIIAGAVVAQCSPLAEEYSSQIKGLFLLGTAASVASGVEMATKFAEDVSLGDIPPAARLLVAHSMAQVHQLAA